MKRKILTLLIILLFPVQVLAEPLLYDVLKEQAETGTLAKEYTGEHQDLLDGSGNQKIYHWYANNETEVNEIDNKRNVLFGGFCWEILRTTDAGGVRLIYNGVADNGDCSNNRPASVYKEYDSSTTIGPTSEYYYADGYRFDHSTGYFYLDDTATVYKLGESTPEDVIGKYTLFASWNGSSSWSIKKVTDYDPSTNTVYYEEYKSNSIFSIGQTGFSYSEDVYSIGTIGYMRNKLFKGIYISPDFGSINQPSTPLEENKYEILSVDRESTVTFDDSSKKWTINVNTDNYYGRSDIKFRVTEANSYVLKFNTSTRYDDTYIYKNDQKIGYFQKSFSGLLELDNLTPNDVIRITYGPESSPKLPLYFSVEIPNGAPISDTRILFGNDVTYENGEYTLVDTIKSDGSAYLDYHHYTCANTTGKCEKVYYYYIRYDYNRPKVVELTNGETMPNLLNEVLYGDDVNKYDSPAKEFIENWFEENLTDYLPYLENSVYCNNRSIANTDTQEFNPNGGDATVEFAPVIFDDDGFNPVSLKCKNITDSFTVGNTKAPLKYPVALPTVPELVILNGKFDRYQNNANNIRRKNISYLTMDAAYYHSNIYFWIVGSYGTIGGVYGSSGEETRPVITLKANTQYISGDGSPTNPYVIREYHNYEATIVNNENQGEINLDVNDPSSILEDSLVTITIEPKDGYVLGEIKITDEDGNEIEITPLLSENQFQFTMPRTSVTISTSYIKEQTLLNPETRDNIIIILGLSIISLFTAIYFNKKRKDII